MSCTANLDTPCLHSVMRFDTLELFACSFRDTVIRVGLSGLAAVSETIFSVQPYTVSVRCAACLRTG